MHQTIEKLSSEIAHLVGSVSPKSRHLRYNCVKSPESSEDNELFRHFFDIVDDKFRKDKIMKIFDYVQDLSIISFNFRKVDLEGDWLEGKVSGTKFRYLCEAYDSNCSPEFVKRALLKAFPNSLVRDVNLYERVKKGTSLDKYLLSLHANN